MMTHDEVERFFEAYAQFYNDALATQKMDRARAAANYSAAFVAVVPAGVMAGNNGDDLLDSMEKGFAAYREMGAVRMNLLGLAVIPIDEDHCVAKVDWAGEYLKGEETIRIPFTISYLLEERDGAPKVFGWIAGDEQVEYRKHGLA